MYPSGTETTPSEFYAKHSELPDKLAQQIQLKDEFVNNAQDKLELVKKSFKNHNKEFIFVGIHSRRTDHLDFQVERLNVIPVDPAYYLDAIELYRKRFSKKKFNLAFIYVSDDLNWGRKRIGATKGGSKNVFFISEESEDKSPYDLALLASCNHTILSYGSFGYFAGFLSNGYKIIPEHFKRFRKREHAHIKKLDMDPFDSPLPRLTFFDGL